MKDVRKAARGGDGGNAVTRTGEELLRPSDARRNDILPRRRAVFLPEQAAEIDFADVRRSGEAGVGKFGIAEVLPQIRLRRAEHAELRRGFLFDQRKQPVRALHEVRAARFLIDRALQRLERVEACPGIRERQAAVGNVPLPLVAVGDLPRCAERQPLHGAALRPVALSVPGIYFQHLAHLCEDQIGKQPHARLRYLFIILCFCNSVNGFRRKLYRKR